VSHQSINLETTTYTKTSSSNV